VTRSPIVGDIICKLYDPAHQVHEEVEAWDRGELGGYLGHTFAQRQNEVGLALRLCHAGRS